MKVAIAGSTGLTGGLSLQLMLQLPQIHEVIAIGRRKTGMQHDKLSEVLLEDGQSKQSIRADAFICCLGTTIKKAGSKEAFRAVDYELPLHLAASLHKDGCQTSAIMSSVGAKPTSSFFYVRTKGEMEEQIKKIGFTSLSILRPSFIAGPREERRKGEGFALGLLKLLNPLLLGGLSKYRAVSASVIAEKLVECVIASKPGTEIFHFHGNNK